nr:hypothetical protein BdHM001_36340 [Bdellovibrio sp. HM001]
MVNLRGVTHFSLSLGIGTVKDHLKAVQKKGLKGFTLTDEMSLAGGVLASLDGKKEKVPVVIGVTLNVTENVRVRKIDHKYDKVVALAKSHKGFKNLSHLVSVGSLPNHAYAGKSRISFDELFGKSEDLVLLSGDARGPVAYHIINRTGEDETTFLRLKEAFGANFKCEVSLADFSKKWDAKEGVFLTQPNNQVMVNKRMIELAQKHGVEIVLTYPVLMPSKEDLTSQEILLQNAYGGNVRFHEAVCHMSEEEVHQYIEERHPYLKEYDYRAWMANTERVFDECKDPYFEPELFIPPVDHSEYPCNQDEKWERAFQDYKAHVEKVHPAFAEILHEADQGEKDLKTLIKMILMLNKFNPKDPAYLERLYSDTVVAQRNGLVNLADYFLFLEAENRKIIATGEIRGLGRGSGAGFLINYGLDLTDVDPIRYGLRSDRFLALDRTGKVNYRFTEVA